MKANMSGFDLRAIVGELSQYVGAYVKKSYMPHYEQIVLRINPKESNQFDFSFAFFATTDRVSSSQLADHLYLCEQLVDKLPFYVAHKEELLDPENAIATRVRSIPGYRKFPRLDPKLVLENF